MQLWHPYVDDNRLGQGVAHLRPADATHIGLLVFDESLESRSSEYVVPNRKFFAPVATMAGMSAFFGIWELWVRSHDSGQYVPLPAPSKVVQVIASDLSGFGRSLQLTLGELAGGVTVGAVVGAILAACMAHSRIFERATSPILVLFQVTPIVAISPAIISWLGFGFSSYVTVVAIVTTVPFAINLAAGLRTVPSETIDLLRLHGAGKFTILRLLRIPNAMPNFFVAMKLCVGLGLIGATIAEWSGATGGLGYQINIAQRRSLTNQLWASVFVLAAAGAALLIIVGAIERRTVAWHDSQAEIPTIPKRSTTLKGSK